jgi:hypothetical protein
MDGNPAMIIRPISSFVPRIEASPVCTQRTDALADRTEATPEPTKKRTQDWPCYPSISDQPTTGFYKWSRPLLPGSDQNIESDVTSRKQSAEKFLPGATTHISDFAIWRILR